MEGHLHRRLRDDLERQEGGQQSTFDLTVDESARAGGHLRSWSRMFRLISLAREVIEQKADPEVLREALEQLDVRVDEGIRLLEAETEKFPEYAELLSGVIESFNTVKEGLFSMYRYFEDPRPEVVEEGLAVVEEAMRTIIAQVKQFDELEAQAAASAEPAPAAAEPEPGGA